MFPLVSFLGYLSQSHFACYIFACRVRCSLSNFSLFFYFLLSVFFPCLTIRTSTYSPIFCFILLQIIINSKFLRRMVLLPKKTRRKLIRYFRSPSTPPDAAAAPTTPRVALASCFQRTAAASESCSATAECCQGSTVCCSAPAECCQGSAVCCSAPAECCSLFCPYQVAFTEPPTLMNLLLGYPFNSRWFMDPLLARKDPVAGGCKYHHQVYIAELSL